MEDFKADDPSMMFLRGLLGAVGGIAQRNKVGNIVMSGLRGGLMGARHGQEAPTEFSVGDSLLGAFAGFPAGMGYKQLSKKELAEKEKKLAKATSGALADLGSAGSTQNVGFLAGPLGLSADDRLSAPLNDLLVDEMREQQAAQMAPIFARSAPFEALNTAMFGAEDTAALAPSQGAAVPAYDSVANVPLLPRPLPEDVLTAQGSQQDPYADQAATDSFNLLPDDYLRFLDYQLQEAQGDQNAVMEAAGPFRSM